MNQFILFILLNTFSGYVFGQKIGVKYGVLGSNQKTSLNNKSEFIENSISSYFEIEYEVFHRKPRKINSSLNSVYWIFELSYSTKGSKNFTIPDLPSNIRMHYLTLSPTILII